MTTHIDDPRVQVRVQTPNEPDAPGHAELRAIGEDADAADVTAMVATPWLLQTEQVRGSRLSTVGLGIYGAHPELELLNVPTMFVEPAIRLLKELGAYVLAGGRLEDGDVMQMRSSLPCLVGFADGAGEEREPVVRVIMLA